MFVVSVRERGKEEHRFTFRKNEVTVGRLRANDVILPKRNISKRHAVISVSPEGVITLHDQGSTNGTYINGTRVSGDIRITQEDKLFMGDYIIQVGVEEEKSAIESDDLGTPPPVPEEDAELRPTVAQMDSADIQAELDKLQQEEELPQALDLADASTEAPEVSSEELPENMTLRMQEDPPDLEEPDEELIDIPLLDEELEALDPLEETVLPAFGVDISSTSKQIEPVTSDSIEDDLNLGDSPLDPIYQELARRFEGWRVEQAGTVERGKALIRIAAILEDLLGDSVEDIERKQLSLPLFDELTAQGLPPRYLDDTRVSELLVSENGTVAAFGWSGESLEAPKALTCAAAAGRLATGLFKGLARQTSPSVLRRRLQTGVVVTLMPSGKQGKAAALQFVKPYQRELSLDSLVETGALPDSYKDSLSGAVHGSRSVFVVGPETATNDLVVHAASDAIHSGYKVLQLGTRFLPGEGAPGRVSLEPEALSPASLLDICSLVAFHYVVADSASGSVLGELLRVSGALQVPALLALRVNSVAQLPAALQGLAKAESGIFSALIDAISPLVVVTGRRAEGTDGVIELGELVAENGFVSYRSLMTQ